MFRTGDVILIDIPNGIGSQQTGKRYAVIVSNNVGNKFSSTVQVLPSTTKRNTSSLPTHAHFSAGECGLPRDTVFLAEQSCVINKFQIINKIGSMNTEQLLRISTAMLYALPFLATAFDNGVCNQPRFLKIQEE